MTAPSVTALRGTLPAGHPVRADVSVVPLAARRPPEDDRLLPGPAARLLGFLLLATFGAHHWMLLIEPVATARAWYAVGTGAVVAGLLILAVRLPRAAARASIAIAGLVAGAALALLAAGVGDEMLAPRRWSELVAGIQRGLEGLPGARVPYRGLDEWLRVVIALGGSGLVVLAAALAFWPRRGRRAGFPGAAVLALVALYAVPAVALIFEAEFVRGAVLALLVLGFLRLERLRRRDAPAAVAAGAAAAVLALAVAPALDGLDPWWDYENWALSAAPSRTTSFAWGHDYGPLQWPRDGRELLRVRSPARTYWKADQLDVFNGLAWVPDRSMAWNREAPGALTQGVSDALLDEWTERLRFSVRNLATESFVAAGSVKAIMMPRRPALQTSRPGIYRTTRTLQRGDVYDAVAYIPRPSERQLREAGAAYPHDLYRYTRVGVRTGGDGVGLDGGPRTTVVDVRGFGSLPTAALIDPQAVPEPARALVEGSELRRTWRLARRLAARSRTPYEYVQRVEAHLARGFEYSETPPAASGTLDGFLFETREGYCQQFSGAMVLLLRFAGIPARVATGFSPGAYDEDAKEYVVRDTDAHSWAEVWFPGIGWVPRDPTPTSSPARSQVSDRAPRNPVQGVRDIGTTTRPGVTALADEGGGPSPIVVAVIVLAVGALAAVGRQLVRRRRRRIGAVAVHELERALRIADGGLPPGATLARLEERFSATPAAAAYLRALRVQRFGRAAPGPTRAHRRALRRALGAGGVGRRLRAWWALPPRP